ncbi:MAG: hypothetical protein EAX96_08655 [Candidatus Lokiarchaeota archaeon]|nr:hypothetical protein [Candidatus Lokiarchaeota archaeon]
MATVFERLEIIVKELASKIDNLASEMGNITGMLNDFKTETNNMFLNFSDILAERFEEISEKINFTSGIAPSGEGDSKLADQLRVMIESSIQKIPTGKISQDTSSIDKMDKELTDLKDSVEMLKDAMNYVTNTLGDVSKKIELVPSVLERSIPHIEKVEKVKVFEEKGFQISESDIDISKEGLEQVIYKGALRSQQPKAQKSTVEPAIRPDIARIYGGVLKPPSTPSTIKSAAIQPLPETKTIKVESTPRVTAEKVPDKVIHLLESIKERLHINVDQLAFEMENIRDEIVKIYKFHPALYELGTFSRKLKKYPPNTTLDDDIRNLLFDKINEWKKRLIF